MLSTSWLGSRCWYVLVLIALAGCQPKSSTDERAGDSPGNTPKDDRAAQESAATAIPLKILVIDDAPLATAIGGQWQAMTGQKLDLIQQTAAELAAHTGPLNSDLVIYPQAWIGTLAERGQIVPLPADVVEGALLRRGDQLEMTRLREVVWGETPYAVPLGSQQFVLLYRKDLLERLGAKVPASWADYQALVAKLAERDALGDAAPAADQPWTGVAEPLGPGWRSLLLLARAAAYAKHRSQYSTVFDFTSLKPRITAPSFVRALEELVAAAPARSADALEMTPDAARQAILSGRCALAVTWLSPARPADDAPAIDERAASQLGVARLPGSHEVYNSAESRWERRGEGEPDHVSLLAVGGLLGSVTKSSQHARGAFNFLALLSNAEWHPRVLTTSRSTGMFRRSHLEAASVWVDPALPPSKGIEYGQLLEQIHREDGWMFAPRLPGRGEYLAALDDAVAAALAGEAKPGDALQAAAEKWEAITNRLGRDAQRQAYRRCLGLEN